jgi:hypothetical protein
VIEVLPMPDDNKDHTFIVKMALRNAIKLIPRFGGERWFIFRRSIYSKPALIRAERGTVIRQPAVS